MGCREPEGKPENNFLFLFWRRTAVRYRKGNNNNNNICFRVVVLFNVIYKHINTSNNGIYVNNTRRQNQKWFPLKKTKNDEWSDRVAGMVQWLAERHPPCSMEFVRIHLCLCFVVHLNYQLVLSSFFFLHAFRIMNDYILLKTNWIEKVT